jgi:low affinity Fe/Cu permease
MKNKRKRNKFEIWARWVSKASGSTTAFCAAFVVVILWAVTGPLFEYSVTWQLIINTGTTIVTFLMVFIIQKAQNKDSLAIQLKLNELVASSEYASNRLVDVEELTEDEMRIIHKYYSHLNELSKKEESLQRSHSIDEAKDQHEFKDAQKKRKKERK